MSTEQVILEHGDHDGRFVTTRAAFETTWADRGWVEVTGPDLEAAAADLGVAVPQEEATATTPKGRAGRSAAHTQKEQ